MAACLIDMRAHMRTASVLLVLSLVGATGCQSAGGKVFGPVSLASAIGGGYLLATSRASIEGDDLVTHNDRQRLGAGLLLVSVLAAGGWAVSEMIHAAHSEGPLGGGVLAPAPVVVEAEPADEPEVEPAPDEPAGAPAVIVVRERHRRTQDPFERGWYLDPADNQDKLYGPDGAFIGRIDRAGNVWDHSGSHTGYVEMSPSCGVACKRSQARKMLLGIPLSQ